MEYCDLYDENRKPLGRIHSRKDPLNPGEFIVAVGIWMFNSRNEILLTKRHPDKRFAPNLWENTGGHVMAGEESAAAVVRELWEETGIQVREDELTLLGSVKVPPYFGDSYAVRRDFPASSVKLRDGETVDVQWVTYARFLEMAGSGALAPSVVDHLVPIQGAFEAALLGL